MIRKFNENPLIHQLPSGILDGDRNTEMFGDRKTKRVFFISNGKTNPFSKLSAAKKAKLFNKLSEDDVATKDLKHLPLTEALEHFSFCLYGGLDSDPDFDEAGELKPSENFMCSDNCKCLKWTSKSISIDENQLTPRELEVLNQLPGDTPNKVIAADLNITESTLNTHLSKLFVKFNVQSKAGLITKAIHSKIVQ